MLTKIRIRNFKRFEDVEFPLSKTVVLIGPNNSGKTTALQALALWHIGLKAWNAKRSGKARPEKRPGVTINRKNVAAVPVPTADLLWHQLVVRRKAAAKRTQNVRIEVTVSGISQGKEWRCGFEFDYANAESFVCRPIRITGHEDRPVKESEFSEIPPEAAAVEIAYLPPMSGLAAIEPKWEPGRINVLVGEGQTAQVLRNVCYQIYKQSTIESAGTGQNAWNDLIEQVKTMFGVELESPQFDPERGEISMNYKEQKGARLDLSCSGRGFQQTLLLLSHLHAHPQTTLLLDEPDAHLEILRQRECYRILSETAERHGSQVIAASHSEVLLNEASNSGTVVAFVGKPHEMTGASGQVLKSLTDLGFDQYYQAEETGWVLYVEDSTDLAILRAFAKTLEHPAAKDLERVFVHYVCTNLPQKARDHFFGLREGKKDLAGIAIFDRLDKELHKESPLKEVMWRRREIENYFCTEHVLLEWARSNEYDDLFSLADSELRLSAMRESIVQVKAALSTFGKPDPWSMEIKATDDVLDPIFRIFFQRMNLPLSFRKSDYHRLAALVAKNDIDNEVTEKLDLIVKTAKLARPV